MRQKISIILFLSLWLALTIGLLVFWYARVGAPTREACTLDAQICPDGTTVGRVGPRCEFAPCPEVPRDEVQAQIDAKQDRIVLDTPVRDSLVTSPLILRGRARGQWYFEGSFPVVIVDWDGRIIGEGLAQAEGEWMTAEFVPFTATVHFDLPADTPYRRGSIILRRDNPSGLPEFDDALEIPVRF